MLTYEYDAGPDISFAFHTFHEVGAPYQPWFKAEIKRRGWVVETRELEAKPWVADFKVVMPGQRLRAANARGNRMSTLDDFLASLKEVRWFSQAGELPSGCLLFDSLEAARDAARDAAQNTATEASRDVAWDPSRDVAWDAEGKAAWYTARKAAWDAVLEFSWDAAADAALVATCITTGNDPSEPNTKYALRRWSVWQAGYGCLCDVGGTLYCYRRVA